jgi:hypothetical protein
VRTAPGLDSQYPVLRKRLVPRKDQRIFLGS